MRVSRESWPASTTRKAEAVRKVSDLKQITPQQHIFCLEELACQDATLPPINAAASQERSLLGKSAIFFSQGTLSSTSFGTGLQRVEGYIHHARVLDGLELEIKASRADLLLMKYSARRRDIVWPEKTAKALA